MQRVHDLSMVPPSASSPLPCTNSMSYVFTRVGLVTVAKFSRTMSDVLTIDYLGISSYITSLLYGDRCNCIAMATVDYTMLPGGIMHVKRLRQENVPPARHMQDVVIWTRKAKLRNQCIGLP